MTPAIYKQRMKVRGNTTPKSLPCADVMDLLAAHQRAQIQHQALTDLARAISDAEATKRLGAPGRAFYEAAVNDPARQARMQAKQDAANAVLRRVDVEHASWGKRPKPMLVGAALHAAPSVERAPE